MSHNALDNSIRADMYQSLGSAVTNFKERLLLPQGEHRGVVERKLRFGLIALPEKYDEKILEDAVEQRMARFLL